LERKGERFSFLILRFSNKNSNFINQNFGIFIMEEKKILETLRMVIDEALARLEQGEQEAEKKTEAEQTQAPQIPQVPEIKLQQG